MRQGGLVAKTQDGRMVKITYAQWLLAKHLKEIGIETDYEFHFCSARDWRFDLVAPDLRLGFECDGGGAKGHSRWYMSKKEKAKRLAKGQSLDTAIERDYEKQNWAQVNAWRILRFTNRQILQGEALKWLKANL